MTSSYQYTPAIWPTLFSAVFMSVMSFYGWHRRKVPGAPAFAFSTLFWSLVSVGTGFEAAAVDVSEKILWYKFQFFWQGPAGVAAFCFVVTYARLDRFLTRRNLGLLILFVLAGSLLILTNEAHQWIWTGFSFDGKIHPLRGGGYWGLVFIGYLLAMLNLPVLIWLFIRSPLHRWPVALILCGQFAIRVSLVLETAGVNPFAPMHPNLLASDFLTVTYAIALFGFRMFDPVPVARATVIEQMRDGMLVLDSHGLVADLNPSAERILGEPALRVRGRQAIEFLPASALAEATSNPGDTRPSEITLCTGNNARSYALHLSRLEDRHGSPLGNMLLLHDVTLEKQAQAERMEQQRALAALQERERVARELHDSLAQVLGYLKMQAQVVKERLAQGDLTAAAEDLARLTAVAQESHADVREYILDARSGVSAPPGFLPALRQHLLRFGETHGIRTELVPPAQMTDCALSPAAEAQSLRIIQEALTNARKHGRPQHVQVSISLDDEWAQIVVQDDGTGFDPALLAAGEGGKHGVYFMQERAEQVGGRVEVQSAPGSGTRVVICMPRRKSGPFAAAP